MASFTAAPINFHMVTNSMMEGRAYLVGEFPQEALIDAELLDNSNIYLAVFNDQVYFSFENAKAIYDLHPPDDEDMTVRRMTLTYSKKFAQGADEEE